MSDAERCCPECRTEVFLDARHLAIRDELGRWFHAACARARLVRADRGIFLSPAELATFAWGAVNYGLGRATYYPTEVVRALGRLAGFLSPSDRAALAGRIRKAEERGNLGHDCDRREWLALKRLLEESE